MNLKYISLSGRSRKYELKNWLPHLKLASKRYLRVLNARQSIKHCLIVHARRQKCGQLQLTGIGVATSPARTLPIEAGPDRRITPIVPTGKQTFSGERARRTGQKEFKLRPKMFHYRAY